MTILTFESLTGPDAVTLKAGKDDFSVSPATLARMVETSKRYRHLYGVPKDASKDHNFRRLWCITEDMAMIRYKAKDNTFQFKHVSLDAFQYVYFIKRLDQ